MGYLSQVTYEADEPLIISYQRDLLGRILREEKKDAEGKLLYEIAYQYDADGNRSLIQRSVGERLATEQFTYDPFKRLITHEDPYGHLREISYQEDFYNPIGQRVLQKTTLHPNQTRTLETYDAFGKLAHKEVIGQGKTLSSQKLFYDPHGNLLLQQDGIYQAGTYQTTHALKYSYTPMHLVKSYTRGYGSNAERTTSFTYTPSGKQASKTTPNQVTLETTYGPLGYLTSLKASDGSCHHTFSYNKCGELLQATDQLRQETLDRTLDPFGNILKEVLSHGLILEKEYDRFDRPTVIKLNKGSTVYYTYDPLYMRKVERGAFSHTYDAYDLSGNLLQETPQGFASIYHTTGLKQEKTRVKSPYYSQSCTYDEMGNLIHTETNVQEEHYSYDGLSQLVQENDQSYAYNSLFTRTHKNKETLQNNLLQELSLFGEREYAYDRNGNRIEQTTPDETISYVYDALNQLVEVIKPQETITFSYDPLGRRISKTLSRQEGSSWKEDYLYDNEVEIGSFDEKGSPKTLKILGNDPLAVAIELDSELFIPFHDCHGNIRSFVNASTKQIAESYSYSAFGEEQISSWKNPWRHAAKRYDADTYLIHFGKRDYDPHLGRWLITDPLDFVNSVNLYQYLFNNPYRYIDKDGQFAFAIPLLMFGLELALPSITTVVCTAAYAMAATTALYGTWKAIEYARDHINTSSYHLRSSTIEEKKEEKSLTDKEKRGRHTPDQEAISELVKEYGKTGVSDEEADILLNWAEEYDFPHRDDRGKPPHWVGGEHIHVGPKHIPIRK